MKAAAVVALVLALLLFVPPALAQLSPEESAATRTVSVDWNHEVDFSQFRTFAFEIPADRYQDVDDVDLRDRIMQSISAQLVAQGLERRDYAGEYNLIVAYGGDVAVDPARSELRHLTVWITITDLGTGAVVWRGTAQQNLVDDNAQNRAIGRSLIEAMFQQWPARQ